jgi:hypothetical protein
MRAFNKESRNAGRPLAHFLFSSFPDLEILINPFVFRRSSFVVLSTSVSSVIYMP